AFRCADPFHGRRGHRVLPAIACHRSPGRARRRDANLRRPLDLHRRHLPEGSGRGRGPGGCRDPHARRPRAQRERSDPAHRGAPDYPGTGRANPAGRASLKYVSTRGHSASQSFTDILLEGLAPDGGLMVPEQWPRLTRPKLDAMRDLPYPRLAFEIMRFFADDYPGADLKAAVDRTYTAEKFGTPGITPMRQPQSVL